MTKTKPKPNPIARLKAYFNTLDRYDKEEANREAILQTAWQIGKEAVAYARAHGLTTKQIALEAGVVQRVLDKHVRVYKLYPQGLAGQIAGGHIGWSHYVAVLYVNSQQARDFYLRTAAAEAWSSHELRRRIRYKYYENYLAAQSGARGQLTLRPIPQKLYTYASQVVRVLDGDTLELDIDVGFHLTMRHTVRLRGIDCPEKGTPAGDQATAYVQDLLGRPLSPEGGAGQPGRGQTVVIRTYKSGKFGRFIVDLWHLPGETDKEKILSQGLFLNQDLLDKGLAEKME